jgi:hypothetical protein
MLEAGAVQVLEWPVYNASGSLDVPISGTWNLYHGSTTAVLTKAVTCTTGLPPSVSFAALDTASLDYGEDYEEVLAFTYADGVLTHRQNLAVVKRRPFPVITDQDLFDEQPSLREQYATGDTTLMDDIETAWWALLRELLDAGRRPWLIREPGAFAGAHVAAVLARKYRGFSVTAPQYANLADHYESQYQSRMRSLRFEIDKSAEVGAEVQRDSARAPTVLCPVGRW